MPRRQIAALIAVPLLIISAAFVVTTSSAAISISAPAPAPRVQHFTPAANFGPSSAAPSSCQILSEFEAPWTAPQIGLDPALRASGDPVLAAQQALAASGVDPGPLDGIFGPQTAQAAQALLTAFQASWPCPSSEQAAAEQQLEHLAAAAPDLIAQRQALLASAPRNPSPAPSGLQSVPPAVAPSGDAPCSAPNLPLAWIAWCESGCNPTNHNPSSSAAGKYQWLTTSWGGYGGYATADAAPESVQDQKSLEAWNISGTGPWEASRGCWGGKF